ncbi:MAG: rhodanese-like domain-containing protein [Gammaproteobacteria bacterium]|nr:rhodanese-like domain-containing protein [Gammaproteobacteria bacterium]
MKSPLAWLALSAILLTGCDKPPYTNLDNDELATLLKQGTPVIDIRRPDEWRQTGIISGSQRITFVDGNGRLQPDFFNRFTAAAGKDEPVILICRTGNRTNVLARMLAEKLGYTKIYNVKNGISHWIREGRPVSKAD